MTVSRSPQCRTFSRTVMDEKSLHPLFPVGGGGWVAGGGMGAVVTNDCCIIIATKANMLRINFSGLFSVYLRKSKIFNYQF